jgi:ABC-2 type transport system permease protein
LVFFSFNITKLGIGLIPIAAILLMVGWVIALFVIGVVLRFGSGAEALAWGILFAVLPLSGVFYPVDALPAAVRPLAIALPTTHAFNAMRTLLDKQGMDWAQMGIAAGETIGLTILVLWFLTAMLKMFRRRGYITRYS